MGVFRMPSLGADIYPSQVALVGFGRIAELVTLDGCVAYLTR